jgi:hypothetical protein
MWHGDGELNACGEQEKLRLAAARTGAAGAGNDDVDANDVAHDDHPHIGIHDHDQRFNLLPGAYAGLIKMSKKWEAKSKEGGEKDAAEGPDEFEQHKSLIGKGTGIGRGKKHHWKREKTSQADNKL